MAEIREISTGNIVETPYAYTFRGKSGAIVVTADDEILMVYDDAINQIGDSITVQAPESMSNFFSLNLTAEENEEDEGTPPAPSLECGVTPIPEFHENPTKERDANGNTVFHLVLRSEFAYPIEFCTKLVGGITYNSTTGHLETKTFEVVNRSGDNAYHVAVISSDNPQEIFARWETCTQEQFMMFIPFTQTEIPDPVTPTSVPIGASSWDFYNTWTDDYSTSIKLASGFSNPDIDYRPLRPFHSYDVPGAYHNVGLIQDPNNNYQWIHESRYVDINFRGDQQSVMDDMIYYVADAGLSYIAFLFYADNAASSYGRKLFVTSQNKRGVNLCYNTHGIAHAAGVGNPGYESSIDTIVSHMREPWYQRIDNKPMVFIDVPNSYSKKAELDLAITCKNDIQSRYGGTDNIYFVLTRVAPILDMNDEVMDNVSVGQYILNRGFNALNWYSSFGDSSKTYAAIAQEDLDRTDEYLTNGYLGGALDVVPCLTTSFYNKPMQTHPIDKAINLSAASIYNTRATNSELADHLEEMIALAESEARIKTICCYSLTEYYENGKVIGPTKNTDGSINREVVDVFKAQLNP